MAQKRKPTKASAKPASKAPAKAPSKFKLWVAGARLRTLPLAVAPVAIGVGSAAAVQAFNLGLSLLALAVALFLQIGVNYANGPLAAGVSLWKTAAVTSTAWATTPNFLTPATTQTNVYASYDLGVVKVAGGFHSEKQDAYTSSSRPAGANAEGWNLAATVPLSANLSLLANYGKKNDKLAANADATIGAIGLKYTLSARTSVYARYVNDKLDNLAAGATAQAQKVTTALVGVQHNF